jgi:hypothetical protein
MRQRGTEDLNCEGVCQIAECDSNSDVHQTRGLSSGRGLKVEIPVGHQWLTPVILAIQEAEIRRITV